MRQVGKVNILASTAAASLMLLLQGCASLYLHSGTAETATQGAKDDLVKINIDKTFIDAKSKLDAFAVDEESGVVAYLVAARNREIANLVRKNLLDDARESPPETLANLVLVRAETILGGSLDRRQAAAKLRNTQLVDLPTRLELISESAEVSRRLYLGALKDFRAAAGEKDPRSTDCDKTPASFAVTAASSEADLAYARVVEQCVEIKQATTESSKIKEILGAAPGSQLQLVSDKSAKAADLITAQTAEAGSIENAIKKLQADPPSNAKDLEAEIKRIRDLLSKAQGVAATAGAQQISNVLEDVLAADLAAKPSADAPAPSKLTTGTLAVLKLTTALAQASDAFSSQSQVVRVNSTLLAIAEQRQKLDMAKLTVELQRTNLQIYAAEEMALIREIALLSATRRIAEKSMGNARLSDGFASVPAGNDLARQGTGAALAAYVDSWNQGRIPYRVLEFREVQVERAYIVQRASKTAKNWVAVLSPPLDDLVAYGKGGIHPETIATILTNLGIMGAILGK